MIRIPVLTELAVSTDRSTSHRPKPILQIKELEPDWERYNAWRASLIESYSNWAKRRKKFLLGGR
jgi:hypothetical protein